MVQNSSKAKPEHNKHVKRVTINRSELSRRTPLLFAIFFAALGSYLLFHSFAATPFVAIEPESSTVTAPAQVMPDAAASGGNVVKFGTVSGQAMPTGDVVSGGHTWHQIVAEDFTKNAALGSWDDAGTLTTCPSNTGAVNYTGATGVQWTAYPKCFKDTYQSRAYRSDQVLSVHDGVLDFWLHVVDGHPAGANPSPFLPTTNRYQTYGRYEIRFKTSTNNLPEYYQAWLLWPNDNTKGKCAESDYPESILTATTVSAFAHYCDSAGTGLQDTASATVDRRDWHTYTHEWLPGVRNYYLDGKLIKTSTNSVWSLPERWQLQTETKSTCDQVSPITCGAGGHLLVDWAVVYSY